RQEQGPGWSPGHRVGVREEPVGELVGPAVPARVEQVLEPLELVEDHEVGVQQLDAHECHAPPHVTDEVTARGPQLGWVVPSVAKPVDEHLERLTAGWPARGEARRIDDGELVGEGLQVTLDALAVAAGSLSKALVASLRVDALPEDPAGSPVPVDVPQLSQEREGERALLDPAGAAPQLERRPRGDGEQVDPMCAAVEVDEREHGEALDALERLDALGDELAQVLAGDGAVR